MLVGVVIPSESLRAKVASIEARNAAAHARIDTLLLRYEQPAEQAWGIDVAGGYTCDWWQIGGRWQGWGNDVRRRMARHGLNASKMPMPRALKANAVWAEDLARVGLVSCPLFPVAIITPYGDWSEEPGNWGWGKESKRERRLKIAWLTQMRKLLRACPGCLVVGVDCHG